MRIGITGATGLIGRALAAELVRHGHEVTAFSRRPESAGGLPGAVRMDGWNPGRPPGRQPPDFVRALLRLDAVVHLAGQTISRRWTAKQKRAIRESRVGGTATLVGALAGLTGSRRPARLLAASAVGWYGPRDDTPLPEDAEPGKGFLSEVCLEWEAASRKAEDAGIETACLRFGVVLSPEGGALRSMLPPFRFGLGGRLGSGRQWMPWVHLADAAGAVAHLIGQPPGSLQQVYNVTAPAPARNAEFTKDLGKALRRPTLFPAPAFALRLMLGEMADALLLTGQRVVPRNLIGSGYRFRHPTLPEALRDLLA